MTDQQQNPVSIPVAVVGMTAIYPGEPGLDGFWRTITGGRDAIGDVPPSHWLIDDYYDPDPKATDRTYCKRGGFIEPVQFDPVKFGLPPNALPSTDSAQLLALIAARKVLDEAMRSGVEVDLDRVDIVLGVASTTELVVQMGSRMQRPIWRKALLENGLSEAEADEICGDIADSYPSWQESTFPGLLGNVVAGRVANRLDLGGSNFVVDAACASSLSALQAALHRLYLHESDLVLTGGVDALNDVMMYMCFSKTPAFSPTGDCRPFSDAADGTIIGEGVGMLALKRLSDAERDGDHIHAVIRGLGSSSDGRASSVYAPRSEGQAKALRRAYERAGYAPETVELLEAHGTATKAGDVAEFAGLKQVFTDSSARIALGSVKSQIGHTKAAAGAAGLIKAILSLQHSTLPGTLKVDRPNPAMGLEETPFYVNAQTRPWVRPGDQPRRAAVSSFGFGGSNFHVTIEEYTGEHRAKRLRALPSELVVLSAASGAELATRAADIAAAARTGESLARIAYESARDFDAAHNARAGLVAADVTALAALADKLNKALADGTAATLKDANISVGFGPAREGKTAFLFPGQGSQYVGMGADLALAFPAAVAVWDSLDGDLADLHRVVFPEPAFDSATSDAQRAELTAMQNAQPAIATTSLAQLALLDALGVRAEAAAGHSFGEVTALAAAGVLPTQRLVDTARTRGVLMAEAGQGQDGAMLAVTASAADVRALLDSQPEAAASLVIANDNAPGQVVLAGPAADIAWAESAAKAAGWTSVRLPVASAFHSPIVAAASQPLTAYLQTMEFGQAQFPVYANATAQTYAGGVAEQLGDQVRQPVRFREMIEAMARDGVTRFIEVGPSRVLTKLVDQILDGTPHLAVALDDPKAGGLRGWHRGLAALAADGVRLNLAALYDDYDEPAKHVPAPKHAVLVGGANVGKPYPPLDGKVTIKPKRTRVSAPQPSVPQPVAATPAPAPAAAHNGVPAPTPAAAAVQTMAAPPSVPPRNGAPEPAPAVQTAPAPAPVLPRTATPTPAAAQAPLSSDAWSIIDRIQQETAQQHERYLGAVANTHKAFLEMSAQMMAEIVGERSGGQQALTPAPVVVHASEQVVHTVHTIAEPPAAVAAPAPVVAPAPVAAPAAAAPAPALAPAAPAPAPAAPAPAAPSVDAGQVVLAIVSEKTGYPADMLGLEMEMESELGIDSIKQVEILAALQAKFPGAPEIPASELSNLRTLQDVVDSVADFASAAPAAAAPAAVAAPAAPAVDAGEVVLGIVSEKTGYPADMLGLDMEMESELGIDSIKQVEILAALQAKFPGAPEIPASELSNLRTLQDVVDSIAGFASGGASAPTAPAAPVAAPAAAAPVSTQDAGEVVLAIVSEKTGYPADMLGLDMEMESELGIDSIKQVEILAALQAKFPGTPEIPASELANLRTLQDVVDSVSGATSGGGSEPDAPVHHSAPATVPAGGLDCTEAAMREVPPTGFAMAGLRDGEVFITRENAAFAEDLERVMISHGIKARSVDVVPHEAAAVISLAALGPVGSPQDCVETHLRAFHAARSVAKSSSRSRLFVTIQSTGARFAEADTPVGVASIAKTAAWEWPNASVRAIDIETLDPERIVAELLAGGSGVEVALRNDGTRLVVVDDVDAEPTGETISVPADGVVVVTGGARGVTAQSALALAARHGLRLALLGRTALREVAADEPTGTTATEIATALAAAARSRGEALSLPQARAQAERLLAEREVRATLSAAERQGTPARYFAADINDTESLRTVLDEVRSTVGPIVGIVHGAGVLADRRLEDLDDEQFVRVFNTKVLGAEALLASTASDDLRFISLFSSIAARAGNPGQCAYAAANAVLESIAAREAARRGDACVVRAFGWGPWDGGMVDATLKSRFLESGVGVIPIDEGAHFFAEHALRRSPATAIVVAAPAEGRLRAARLDWDVSTDNLPVLADHQVRGRVVVPVVIVLDAMLRAVRGLVPDASPVIRDFQVLSGVTFAECEQQALTLDFEPTGSAYTVSVQDPEGRKRYRAVLETESQPAPSISVPHASGEQWPFGVGEIYGGPLFHGPRFAAIEQLDAVGPAGAGATLKGLDELGWPEGDWAIDPVSVDGGLQLGILWASAHGRPLVLPVRIGRAVFHQPFGEGGSLRCRIAAKPVNDKRVDFDIALETADGTLVAELEAVEFYVAGTGADTTA
ncbi:type I polyketide synthase [Mycobacterium sp. DL592]|uniref:type I polyketide synthase n=1 Tax=Mycobacterium sp. DL592 TaxID=2675524 RepID=UPI0014239D2F|nr:type I polyketide synthase [Mycobacterium sp. DL592]